MRGWHSVVYAFAATLGGCLLTTSFDGLSGGSPSNRSIDGGDDAVAKDATTTTTDGPTDAGLDAEADAPDPDFRCTMITPAPAFCSDFDTGTIDGILGTPNIALGGSVVFDETTFVSRGRSLKLTTPAIAPGLDNARASVGRSFELAGQSTISVRFDMRIDSADGTAANATYLTMGKWELTLFIGVTSSLREGVRGDGGTAYTSTTKTAPAASRWIAVSLTVTLGASSSNAVVAYDGVKQSAVPLVAHQYIASSVRADVGFNYIGRPDNGREMHIDNLVVDIK